MVVAFSRSAEVLNSGRTFQHRACRFFDRRTTLICLDQNPNARTGEVRKLNVRPTFRRPETPLYLICEFVKAHVDFPSSLQSIAYALRTVFERHRLCDLCRKNHFFGDRTAGYFLQSGFRPFARPVGEPRHRFSLSRDSGFPCTGAAGVLTCLRWDNRPAVVYRAGIAPRRVECVLLHHHDRHESGIVLFQIGQGGRILEMMSGVPDSAHEVIYVWVGLVPCDIDRQFFDNRLLR